VVGGRKAGDAGSDDCHSTLDGHGCLLPLS
jgi:hypothetical protein